MHTMVIQMSTDPSRHEQVARHLCEDVVGWAKQQPGFVSGRWLISADRREGMGVVVFASEDAATRRTGTNRTSGLRRISAGAEHVTTRDDWGIR